MNPNTSALMCCCLLKVKSACPVRFQTAEVSSEAESKSLAGWVFHLKRITCYLVLYHWTPDIQKMLVHWRHAKQTCDSGASTDSFSVRCHLKDSYNPAASLVHSTLFNIPLKLPPHPCPFNPTQTWVRQCNPTMLPSLNPLCRTPDLYCTRRRCIVAAEHHPAFTSDLYHTLVHYCSGVSETLPL